MRPSTEAHTDVPESDRAQNSHQLGSGDKADGNVCGESRLTGSSLGGSSTGDGSHGTVLNVDTTSAVDSDFDTLITPQRKQSFLKYLPHTMYNFTMKPSYRGEDGARRLVRVGVGAWYAAAFHVATTIATPPAFASLPFALAALGWYGGCSPIPLICVTRSS